MRTTPFRADATVALSNAAHRTRRIARNANIAPLHRQRVENQQSPRERFTNTCNELERFAGLSGADDSDKRREYAHRRATRFLDLVAFAE